MTLGSETWLHAAGALAAVLLLIWLAARALRATPLAARPGARPGRRLSLQETLALDARRRLIVVRCDSRDLLLLTGGVEDLVIGWLPGDATP